MKPADYHTETWHRLKALLEARLAAQRDALEHPSLAEVKTALVRGRISELKFLLALDRPGPAPGDAAADGAYVE